MEKTKNKKKLKEKKRADKQTGKQKKNKKKNKQTEKRQQRNLTEFDHVKTEISTQRYSINYFPTALLQSIYGRLIELLPSGRSFTLRLLVFET